jgi:hypothetical protein
VTYPRKLNAISFLQANLTEPAHKLPNLEFFDLQCLIESLQAGAGVTFSHTSIQGWADG